MTTFQDSQENPQDLPLSNQDDTNDDTYQQPLETDDEDFAPPMYSKSRRGGKHGNSTSNRPLRLFFDSQNRVVEMIVMLQNHSLVRVKVARMEDVQVPDEVKTYENALYPSAVTGRPPRFVYMNRQNQVGWLLIHLNPEITKGGVLQACVTAYENCELLGNRISRREQKRLAEQAGALRPKRGKGRGRPRKSLSEHFSDTASNCSNDSFDSQDFHPYRRTSVAASVASNDSHDSWHSDHSYDASKFAHYPLDNTFSSDVTLDPKTPELPPLQGLTIEDSLSCSVGSNFSDFSTIGLHCWDKMLPPLVPNSPTTSRRGDPYLNGYQEYAQLPTTIALESNLPTSNLSIELSQEEMEAAIQLMVKKMQQENVDEIMVPVQVSQILYDHGRIDVEQRDAYYKAWKLYLTQGGQGRGDEVEQLIQGGYMTGQDEQVEEEVDWEQYLAQ